MKNTFILAIIALMLSSCSKVTQKRLEGTWIVKEIKEITTDSLDSWHNLLDTNQVKVIFYEDGTVETYFLKNDSITNLSTGTYHLSEDDETLEINDSSTIFNAQGHPLDVTDLHKKSMTLEGRYYLQLIFPNANADAFVTLRWELEK